MPGRTRSGPGGPADADLDQRLPEHVRALAAEGYPPLFVEGFTDGCASGRHAAGELDGFRKNVPVYLQQPNYAVGWDDGFRQCQARADSELEGRQVRDSEADRAWRHSKNQAWGQALRPSSRTL